MLYALRGGQLGIVIGITAAISKISATAALGLFFVYAASLGALLASSFWSVDAFTASIVHTWSLDQYRKILSLQDTTYLRIAARTVLIAAAVTVGPIVIGGLVAFPLPQARQVLRAFRDLAATAPWWSVS